MSNEFSSTGAIESPQDYRSDLVASSFAVYETPSSLPSFRYSGIDRLPVFMQALEPSCVSDWAIIVLKDYFYRKTGKLIDFSVRFLDAYMKTHDGQPIDGGAFPSYAMKDLVNIGCATTATCPDDTSLPVAAYRDPSCITPEALDEAKQYRIPGFIKVPLEINTLRNYIAAFGLVGTLKNIGSEWWLPSWNDKDIDPLRIPSHVVSGHMTVDFGWDGFYNNLRNSWSERWADRGNAKYNFLDWLPYTREAWVIAEIPDDIRILVSALPSPSNFHYSWQTDMTMNGPSSDDVKYLQIALMILGHMIPPPVDQMGTYGPKTAAAVLAFQQANNVPTQGLGGTRCGPLTRSALNTRFRCA